MGERNDTPIYRTFQTGDVLLGVGLENGKEHPEVGAVVKLLTRFADWLMDIIIEPCPKCPHGHN